MALSVKNLTHARSEVRGVCESLPHGEVHIFVLSDFVWVSVRDGVPVI